MKLHRTLLATAVALLTPFSMGAVTVRECPQGKPVAESYTWDFKAEANDLFHEIELESNALRSTSAELAAMSQGPSELGWQAHADALIDAKQHVNRMNDMLCRLTAIEKTVAPWQAQLIDRIRPDAILSAENVDEAINYLNDNRIRITSVGAPVYHQHIETVYDCARQLNHTVSSYTELASARARVRALEETGK